MNSILVIELVIVTPLIVYFTMKYGLKNPQRSLEKCVISKWKMRRNPVFSIM